jgi:hypothetical protein
MDKSYEKSPENRLTLGSGLRYSASAGLLAYGVSRLALVAVWTLWAPAGDTVNSMVKAATHFFAASTGLVSVALALVIVNAPLLTRKHVRFLGLLILSLGIGVMVIELAYFLNFPDQAFLFSQISFLASIAYSVLSIYLGAGMLRGSLALGRSTFTALALLAVVSLLRSIELSYLVSVPLSGHVNPLWLRQLLYAVSMGLAFAAFVSASRKINLDLSKITGIREYTLLRGAVFLYGLAELVVFIDVYLLRFDEFMVRAAEYLGTAIYAITVYLWPILDAIFALSIIAFAAYMKQVTPPPT